MSGWNGFDDLDEDERRQRTQLKCALLRMNHSIAAVVESTKKLAATLNQIAQQNAQHDDHQN